MSDEILNEEIKSEVKEETVVEDVKSEETLTENIKPEETQEEEISSAEVQVENTEDTVEDSVESPKIESEKKSEKKSKKSKNKKAAKETVKESSEAEKNPVVEETPEAEKEPVAEEKKETEPAKKEMKGKKITVKFSELYDKLQSSIALLIIVCIAAILVMVASATAVFFHNVKGHEQVLVPNVVGKKLEDALLEMQVKELYPKINLRYSNIPGDEGTILEQSPESGAIVRGYSRVNLVVSRGVIVDKVGNYVGMNIEDLKLNLQTLFAGQTRPLIVLADPEYKPDLSEAGTILEQNPPEGTEISQPVTVKLIVSRGPNYDNTRAPHIIGQSVNDVLQTIARSKIIFDFTSHIASENEKPGTVVTQDRFDSEYIPNYSRVNAEFAFPESSMNDNSYGIFQTELSLYPYPVQMRIVAVPSEGSPYTILNFLHSGGHLTVPYAVPSGTKLILYVVDRETASIIIE